MFENVMVLSIFKSLIFFILENQEFIDPEIIGESITLILRFFFKAVVKSFFPHESGCEKIILGETSNTAFQIICVFKILLKQESSEIFGSTQETLIEHLLCVDMEVQETKVVSRMLTPGAGLAPAPLGEGNKRQQQSFKFPGPWAGTVRHWNVCFVTLGYL
jgi:hypothetical protein